MFRAGDRIFVWHDGHLDESGLAYPPGKMRRIIDLFEQGFRTKERFVWYRMQKKL